MGNIGTPEILIVLIVALLVLGPQRLPQAARQVGRAMAEFRKVTGGLQAEMRDAMSSIETEIKSATDLSVPDVSLPETTPPPAKPYIFEPPAVGPAVEPPAVEPPVVGTPVVEAPVLETPAAGMVPPPPEMIAVADPEPNVEPTVVTEKSPEGDAPAQG